MPPAASQQGATSEPAPIRWANLWWVAAVLAVMIATIRAGNLWALNFLHIATGLLLTGLDLFMGLVPAIKNGWT